MCRRVRLWAPCLIGTALILAALFGGCSRFTKAGADCEVYRIKHTGPYRYLGNAWASGIMHARNTQFRQNRAVHPFEIYENDPAEVPEGDLVTVVHFPAK